MKAKRLGTVHGCCVRWCAAGAILCTLGSYGVLSGSSQAEAQTPAEKEAILNESKVFPSRAGILHFMRIEFPSTGETVLAAKVMDD